MSVLVNMEIPKSCSDCWALDDYGDYPRCRITHEQRGYTFNTLEKRMDKCPLISVTKLSKEEETTEDFKKELAALLNRYSWDSACETPDYILADYIERCLNNYCSTVAVNIAWHKWSRLNESKI